MPGRIVWNIAAPMIGLGIFLLGLGVFAAWNVHKQQQTSSALVIREVHGMLAIDELHMAMRDIRYQINLFLRTRELQSLQAVADLHRDADEYLRRAKGHARTEREQELIGVVEDGYQSFFDAFQHVVEALPMSPEGSRVVAKNASTKKRPREPRIEITPEHAAELTRLADDVLTNSVLEPLRECLAVNQQVVERTNEASQDTAQHLKIGFLLLGVCGGAAGLLMGIAIARAVGKSIVQLNVSVRGVAGRLSDVTGPVTFSHTGDLMGVEAGLRTLESDIAEVVERLQRRETELLRAEQLAHVGQLAAGVAHELRNPLMPMKMLVQAAIERGDDAGLKGRSLQVLNDEIARLETSIQGFLDFARPPVPEKTTVDLRDITQRTLDLIAGRCRQQNVEVRSTLPPQPVLASVDPIQIRQLLLNLLLNAVDALPGSGTIELVLESVPGGIAIRVLDDGPGIPSDLLPAIFEPFVTTKETGTGLGLSICQRIVAAHGGNLTAANRASGGAEFTLLLPTES